MYLVTGAAGFIGSHLMKSLLNRAEVKSGQVPLIAVDRFGKGEKWHNLAGIPLGECLTPEALWPWLAANHNKVSYVFHLGANSTTTESNVDQLIEENFRFSLRLWDFCARKKIGLINASSAATYGDGAMGFDDRKDMDYLTSLRPLNPYAWSKHLIDMEFVRRAAMAADDQPSQWVSLKFFNVYGPHESHKGGQKSVILQFFEQIADKGQVSLFASNNKQIKDGEQARDFIWIDDCIKQILWHSFGDGKGKSGIFNVGTGQATSFNAVAQACFHAMGKKAKIKYIETPPAIAKQYQNFTKANMAKVQDLGYQAAPTALSDAVASYLSWYRENWYHEKQGG